MVGQQAQPQIIQVAQQPVPAGQRWTPVVGDETVALLDHLGLQEPSRSQLLSEAADVLGRCIPPTSSQGQTTGLVVGYVQSGKTMSFTTVAALARDNAYRMVIVISGTTKNLFTQSADRLQRDLRIGPERDKGWLVFRSPIAPARLEPAVRGALSRWTTATAPGLRPQTVLVTVMKNGNHLDRLLTLLSMLQLDSVPTIVIDDEADQAGLNTLVGRGQQSATYTRLLQLRRSLPQHSYLQYTATPQGPLLINILDVLSPDWPDVLTPGPDYAGGREFFISNPRLVRTIPRTDIPTQNRPLVEPPDSLLEAMQFFFVGVVAGLKADQGRGNRTMMVHPSQETMRHGQYVQWVRNIRDTWMRMLSLPTSDPDRQALISDFVTAHADLGLTALDMPPFSELEPYLHDALAQTLIEEVNAAAGPTPAIDWHSAYPLILVGGEVLSRGYTVEGLTVTYMPRGGGVGNADTIQQRARFFGYKRNYLGFCRVYLELTMQTAYRDLVEHEEYIREELIRHRDMGGTATLNDWRRAIILTMVLRPTRANILDINYTHSMLQDQWYQTHSPLDPEQVIQNNRDAVQRLVTMLAFSPDVGDPRRTDDQIHQVISGVPLRTVYDDLLSQVRLTQPGESAELTRLLVHVERYLRDKPNETATVYLMSGGRIRQRGMKDGRILNLFQGRNPLSGPAIYPGDRVIRAPQGLTVQVHNLKLTEKLTDAEPPCVLADNVPVLAVWVPSEMARPVLVQDQ